jgi:hypothetical protein
VSEQADAAAASPARDDDAGDPATGPNPAPRADADPGSLGFDETAEEEPDEQPDPGTPFVRPVVHGSTAKNMFLGPLYVGTFVAGGGTHNFPPIHNLTAWAERIEQTFVPPASFERLLNALERDHLALLVGPECGKGASALVALRRRGHDPILQLAADVPSRDLVGSIEAVVRDHERAGILIESLDARTLADLAGYGVRRVQATLGDGVALVVTAVEQEDAFAAQLSPIAADAPPPDAVVEALAAARGEPAVGERAVAAIDLMSPPIPPQVATNLFETAASDALLSPEQLAARFECRASDSVLARWLDSGPSLTQLAAVVAAAALDGAPTAEVDVAEAVLTHAFTRAAGGAESGQDTPIAFRRVDHGWPPGVVERRQEVFTTHFGRQPTEVISLRAPYDRQRVLSYLWREVSHGFRRPFLDWLHELAHHDRWILQSAAAVTAGTLFIDEPLVVERELLRPWARADRPDVRACAALALGVPVALGHDSTAARALTRSMGSGADLRRRHVAVMAYGGLLGAWDASSAAPSHLWRIGNETPHLARRADAALAALMVAGEDASRVRATVLGVLVAEAGERRLPTRVERLLPRICRALTSRNREARASLAALLDAEEQSRRLLARLFVRVLTAPRGAVGGGRAAIQVLLRAVADGRVDRDVLLDLIREMKAATTSDAELARLGAVLERVLRLEAANRAASTGEIASMALLAFFAKKKERDGDGG